MRTRIAAAMTALALLLFPLGASLIVSRSFDITMARERERALSEEAAISRAVMLEVESGSKEALMAAASSLQRRYGSDDLQVILITSGMPMANAVLPQADGMSQLLATATRATLLDGKQQVLYIAHCLREDLTLLVASDVSAVYTLRDELALWAGVLSLAGVGLSALLSVLVSRWLAKPYKQLAQQRQELIDALAHEMRTPLTAILGGVRLLERADLPNNQRENLLAVMGREVQRLTQMDERLLLLTRLEHETASFTSFSSMDMAREALSLFEGVTLVGEDSQYNAQRELMIQLMRNLVVNAQRAGGGVTVCMKKEGFSVEDHGCGMTKEQVARAFEPFYRADKSRARAAGGAGLGLTLCAKIAKLHGATLTIESEPGKGTTVRYTMLQL